MLPRVVRLVVHAPADREVRVLGRRGDDDLLCAGLEVFGRLGAVREESAALEHQLHAERFPRQLAGIALGEHPDHSRADRDAVVLGTDLLAQRSVDRIVLQEMRERLRIGDVVDGDEVERLVTEAGAQDVAADAPEPVDADADLGHEATTSAEIHFTSLSSGQAKERTSTAGLTASGPWSTVARSVGGGAAGRAHLTR